jgi:putative acetyltransferase
MEQIILHLRANECIAAVLLGNPKYYPRFGFKTASEFGLHNEYGAVDTFMALELQPNALKNITGLVRYVSAFVECSA